MGLHSELTLLLLSYLSGDVSLVEVDRGLAPHTRNIAQAAPAERRLYGRTRMLLAERARGDRDDGSVREEMRRLLAETGGTSVDARSSIAIG